MSDGAKRCTASPRRDGDAVRIVPRDGGGRTTVLYLALAVVLVACSVGYIVTTRRHAQQTPTGAAPAPMSATDNTIVKHSRATGNSGNPAAKLPPKKITAAAGRAMTSRRAAPTPVVPADATEDEGAGEGDTTPDLSTFIPPGEAPSIGEVIEQLHNAGIYSGIGAFSPPGTSPPLVGLAVPDDFELPEGYVRHFQATDDGQRIEAILMFSPDYEFFDEDGQPIEIPANRVVPPDLAPPGLPMREIEIPPPREPGDLSR